MKTIELTLPPIAVAELFDLAGDDDVLIRLPNGKVFLLTAVTDDTTIEADFADEIARTRQHSALMALLRERGQETGRVSSQEARKRLGID
jgi:hypothetical protein